MILRAARTYARRMMLSAGIGFSQHACKAWILSGADPERVVEGLKKSRNRRTFERRMRLAGRILAHVGDEEGARRIFTELLEHNPAQPLWLKYATGVPAHDVIVLDRYGIAYCPMPKNASSSIKARMNYLMRGTNDVYAHRFFTNVYETSQTTDLPDLSDYFSFTVIRDPVERLLSYYQKNIIEEDSLARELENSRVREIMSTHPSIDEFVGQLESYIFYFDDAHHHTLPQSAYISTALPHLSRVYRISETDSIFSELSSRTQTDLTPTYLLKSNVNVEKLLPELSKTARDKLRAFYRVDYELLGPWLDP